MSVLVCPVCQGSMREIDRQGVTIDTCTQCRGVWLDRGELEKLAGLIAPAAGRGFLADAGHRPARDRAGATGWRDDDDDDAYRSRKPGSDRPQKSRVGRFLDFFD